MYRDLRKRIVVMKKLIESYSRYYQSVIMTPELFYQAGINLSVIERKMR